MSTQNSSMDIIYLDSSTLKHEAISHSLYDLLHLILKWCAEFLLKISPYSFVQSNALIFIHNRL